MKFSLCTTGFKDKKVEDVLKLAVNMELGGIELWIGHIDDYLERNGSLEDLKYLVDFHNLAIPAISPYTYFSKSEVECSESNLIIHRCMEIAKQLNCPLVRTFVGHFPSREVSSTQWDTTIHALKEVLKSTDMYDTKLGIEIHNNTFADTRESIQDIVSEINHPRLKLIFDGFNLYVDRLEQMDTFNRLVALVDHVHVKNFHWNHGDWDKSIPTSLFGGDVNQEIFLQELEKRHYQNFVSIEYFGQHAERCIRESIKELQDSGFWNNR